MTLKEAKKRIAELEEELENAGCSCCRPADLGPPDGYTEDGMPYYTDDFKVNDPLSDHRP